MSTPAGEWAIPDPITPAYVERVYNFLAELEAAVDQSVLDRATSGDTPVVEDHDALRAQYERTRTPVLAAFAADTFRDIDPQVVVEALVDPIEPDTLSGSSIVEVADHCVRVQGEVDSSGRLVNGGSEVIAVRLERPENGAQNPTGWVIASNASIDGSGEPCPPA